MMTPAPDWLPVCCALERHGEVFISHTRPRGAVALRLAVGHLQTDRRHVARAWALAREHAARL
ncbi:MAG: hypothetical protein FJW23_00040 [Acidimicrobiia bacterium]|nr:hypothetical protein [Acidimicrobiia bacterium]